MVKKVLGEKSKEKLDELIKDTLKNKSALLKHEIELRVREPGNRLLLKMSQEEMRKYFGKLLVLMNDLTKS